MQNTKILALVDDTEHSRTALRFACSQAKALDAPIEIMMVIEKDATHQSILAPAAANNQEILQYETLLDRYAKIAKELTGTTPSLLLQEGELIETVIHIINQDSNIGMLIIGYDQNSKSHTAVSLLSNLGNALMIPIVIIPGNLTHHQISTFFPKTSTEENADDPSLSGQKTSYPR